MEDIEMERELIRVTLFIEQVFEIAFGEDAVNKGYTFDDVLAKLDNFSKQALAGAELTERLAELKQEVNYWCDDTQENSVYET